MSLEDPNMCETFPSWTGDAERGAVDKMPMWGVPGETPEEGEWPARDAVPQYVEVAGIPEMIQRLNRTPASTIGLRPAEVTPEMLKAADVAEQALDEYTSDEYFTVIFQAMHAAAPVPLVSDAETALTQAKKRASHNSALLERTEIERDTLRAELMAAHDRLAKFTAQNAVKTDAPDPIANAIRPREVDPRRMGLA